MKTGITIPGVRKVCFSENLACFVLGKTKHVLRFALLPYDRRVNVVFITTFISGCSITTMTFKFMEELSSRTPRKLAPNFADVAEAFKCSKWSYGFEDDLTKPELLWSLSFPVQATKWSALIFFDAWWLKKTLLL